MNRTEFGHGQGNHAARAVQLHRAAAEGDHGVVETQVLRLEVVDVAKHLRLRVVRVEDRVREELRSSAQAVGDGDGLWGREVAERDGALGRSRGEDIDQGHDVFRSDTLVQGQPNVLVVDPAQVDTSCERSRMNRFGILRSAGHVQGERIKELGVNCLVAKALDRRLDDLRQAVDLLGNTPQVHRTVVNRIHRCHIGKERLAGTNVTGSLLATDMLFTS